MKTKRIGLMLVLLAGLGCAVAQADATGHIARAAVKSINSAELSSELAGRVINLPFRMGDSFRKGDVLVGLDCQLYEAQASKVAAELQAASVKLASAKELKTLNAIGDLDLALAESEYAQSQAELSMARINTGRCEVRAPWGGRVAELRISRYENIQQQQPLIVIIDDTALEAEVVVPTAWLSWLKPGQPLELQAEGMGVAAKAKVSAISPAIDAVSQTVLIRADIAPGAPLMPGVTATAEFFPVSLEDK